MGRPACESKATRPFNKTPVAPLSGEMKGVNQACLNFAERE